MSQWKNTNDGDRGFTCHGYSRLATLIGLCHVTQGTQGIQRTQGTQGAQGTKGTKGKNFANVNCRSRRAKLRIHRLLKEGQQVDKSEVKIYWDDKSYKNKYLHEKTVLPHSTKQPFCQLAILSTCNFVNLLFSSNCFFIQLLLHQIAVLSTCCFVKFLVIKLRFSQLAVLSIGASSNCHLVTTCCFVKLLF